MIVKYLKKTGKHSIVYGLGNLVSKIIAFLLVPVYTRVLTPSEYGILSLITVSLSITAIVLNMGMQTTLFRFYIFDYTDEKNRKKLVSTILIFLNVTSILLIFILIYFSDNISSLLFSNIEYSFYLKIVFVATFFEINSHISLSLLRSQEKSKIFSIFTIIRLVIQISFILFFVVYLREGVVGALKGILISQIIFYVINLPVIIKNIDFSFSFKILKKALRFGIPLIPVAISSWIMTMIDRIFLERIYDASVVGIYTIAYNFGMILNLLFVSPVQLAWAQIKWTIIKKEEEAKNIFSYIMTYYMTIGVFLLIGIVLSSENIIRIFTTPAYYSAIEIVPFITIGYLFFGYYYMVNIGISLKSRTEINAVILILSASINIFLNYVLIPRYSMMGAAISTTISYISLAILSYFINRKFYQVNYQWSRIVKIFISGFIILSIFYNIPEVNLVFSILIKLLLIFSYFIILYILKFYEKREIRKIKCFINDFRIRIFNKKNG